MNEDLKVTTFEVIMTTTEYHHFEDLCSDAAGNLIVDLNGVVQAHLITQIPPESVPLGTHGVNFHVEVEDPFTEEVFHEFDTNMPDLEPKNTPLGNWW